MESFDTNIKLDYDSLKLNKLLKDARSGNITDPTNANQTSSFHQTVNSVQSRNGMNTNNIETLDLSNEVEKENPFQNTNLENQKSAFEQTESINLNQESQLNMDSAKDNAFQTGKIENMADSKMNMNEKHSIENSERLTENSNLQNNSTLSQQSNMNHQSINASSNNSINVNEEITSSIKQNNSELNNSGFETHSNNTSTVVTTENIQNTRNSEVEVYEYESKLKEYGITDQDITRLVNKELTIEELMREIENDADTSRKRILLETSYLKSYGLEVTNMGELKNKISTIDEEIEKLSDKRAQLGNRDFVTENIDKEIAKCAQTKDSYQYIYDNINREVENYLENVDPYLSKPDFLENASPNDDYLKTIEQLRKDYSFAKTGTYDNRVIDAFMDNKKQLVDIVACIINNKGDISQGYFTNDNGVIFRLKSNDEFIEHYTKWAPLMAEEEVAIFNYIYNQKGVDAARDYLDNLSDKLDNRYLMKKTKEDSEYAKIHPVEASVGSIFLTPLEGLNAMKYSVHLGKDIKRADVYSTGNVWRGKVAQDIAQNHGEGLSFLYGTGMSMVDSASLIGLSVATGGTATPVLSATIMGSRAYVSTINEALDRGLPEGSAIALAFSSAVVETAMESISVSHLLNLEEKMGKNTIKLTEKIARNIDNPTLAKLTSKSFYIGASALSQGLVEGEEEFATEILNYVADIFIAKDLSNYTTSLNQYLEQGYTENEALAKTMNDFSKQAATAFLGGFISGACFGTLGSSVTTYQSSKKMTNHILEQYNESTEQNIVFSTVDNGDFAGEAQMLKNKDIMIDEITIKNLDVVVSHLNYHFQNRGLEYLRAYTQTGNINYIVDYSNLRDVVRSIPMDKIRGYIDNAVRIQNEKIAKDLDTVVSYINRYYPDKGLEYLRAYAQTGNINYIVDYSNVRDIVRSISMDKIKSYVDNANTNTNDVTIENEQIIKNLDIVVSHLDYYLQNKGLEYLRAYTQTGNINYIVDYSNLRDVVRSIPIDKIKGYIDNKISSNIKGKDQDIPQIKRENRNIVNAISGNTEMYNFFESINKSTGQYGVDQADVEKLCSYKYSQGGVTTTLSYRKAKKIVNEARENNQPLPHITKISSKEYDRLKQKLVNQGFSQRDASIILSSINDAGACSYASLCNNIMYSFRNLTKQYEEIFGYPMIREEGGETYLNSAELLLDIYLFANTERNGGDFIKGNQINKRFLSSNIDVFGRNILEARRQVYMSSSQGRNKQAIKSFLKSKTKNTPYSIKYKTSPVLVSLKYSPIKYNLEQRNAFLNQMKEDVKQGYTYGLGIYKIKDHPIHMLSFDKSKYSDKSTETWREGGGHAVAITKVDDDGFIVSSWGEKYLVPYEELFNGGAFIINRDMIEIWR